MWRSSDGGDTFDEYHVLYGLSDDLKSNRSYTRAFIEGDDIHFASNRLGWQEHVGEHPIGNSEGVYYIRYNIAGKTFHRANGATWESTGVLSEEARISTVVVPWRIDDTVRKYEVMWMNGLMNEWTRYNTSIHAIERAPGAP